MGQGVKPVGGVSSPQFFKLIFIHFNKMEAKGMESTSQKEQKKGVGC